MTQVQQLCETHGVSKVEACQALGLPRATYYRRLQDVSTPSLSSQEQSKPKPARATSPRALSQQEKAQVLKTLYAPEFVDVSPYQAYASLLDQGVYLCSVSTMYRLLRAENAVHERRHQTRHQAYAVPRLEAWAPNQVWSWDITKLAGPNRWKNYYCYMILDMYSRCVVGFMVAEAETSQLAKELIEQSCAKQEIEAKQLILHADRGTQMTSKTVNQLLIDLGVEQSHSRPRVSNDNAFSEAQFKTLKSRPHYPSYFSSLEDARQWCREFVEWYNHEHHHQGIGWMTPAQVHYGKAAELLQARQVTLDAALAAHPNRFVRGQVHAPGPPSCVLLNPPPQQAEQ